MTREFDRLSREELAEELAELEERLARDPGDNRLRNLVQNLRIHQIELEMQNRELREAQQALEEARDRYADLYDFAPVGYITLDAKGVIREINLTGSHMLGQPRTELIGRPFAARMESGQSGLLFRHLHEAMDDDLKARAELKLRSDRGRTLWVALESVRARQEGTTLCRTAMIDVTERRLAEESQKESEARLALIADNIPILISYVDSNRRYVFNNAAYEQWFGHSRNYIHGRHMREVLGDDAYASITQHVDAALAGEKVHFEADIPYRDAGNRYVSASYLPHKNRDNEVVGFFVVIHDLSERRRAERALAEEREFVSTVLDTAGALVLVTDKNGRIMRFNRECERVCGYKATEVEGKRFDLLLAPEERAGVENAFERLSSGDFPTTHENHLVAKDGTRRLIAWLATAMTDNAGRVTHVIGTGIDVTEQRRMEADLRHREWQLRVVTNAVPVLIAYVDRDLRYRFTNAAYRDWFGLKPEEMIGHRVDEVMGDDAYQIVRPYIRRALEGEEVSYENVVERREYGKRHVNGLLVPDRNATGEVEGYFTVVTDVTKQKQRDELEKRRLLESAHLDRLSTMGEMTTEIAHELNQPLTAIATTADVLVNKVRQKTGENDSTLAEALGEISNQAHRAAQVVKHVRSFARRREPDMGPIELKAVIDNALSLLRVENRSNGVRIETSFNGPGMVQADPVLLEQLIVNLARNAVEAMRSVGTVSPRLSLTTGESEDGVEIRVADNGPGLSVEAREHLFEPFFTTKADGMGLGLAICRSIAEAQRRPDPGGQLAGRWRRVRFHPSNAGQKT